MTIKNCLCLTICGLFCSCGGAEDQNECPKKTLPASLAGSWYNSDSKKLGSELQNYLDQVKAKPINNVIALMLPHAGYRFSGPTAAYGIKAVMDKSYDRVVVIGPSHRMSLPDRACVPEADHFGTPFGDVPLDTKFMSELLKNASFSANSKAFSGENSVEMEIPFLRYAFKDLKLVPVVVGQLSDNGIAKIAAGLRELVDERTLVVASTDFTHYGPNFNYVPFSKNIPENLEKLDMGAFDEVKKLDPNGFIKYIERTGATICGRYSVAVLLSMLPKSAKMELLHYDSSGKILGDYRNSVSYLSAAATGSWSKDGKTESNSSGNEVLNDDERKTLLKLARESLAYYMKNGKEAKPEELGIKITPAMKNVMGCFVTLHKNGRLRGCIGEIFPRRELFEAVRGQVLNSALHDPRFPAVTEKELPELEIEISALTPPKSVPSYNDIIIGKHGMTLNKNGRSAVFLPQVAPEQGWDLAETLTHLAMKAGLRPDDWKKDTKFQVFEAIVFNEKNLRPKFKAK